MRDDNRSELEPKPDPRRHSTKDMVKIAQRVMRDPNASDDAKSLAGSVISQADPND